MLAEPPHPAVEQVVRTRSLRTHPQRTHLRTIVFNPWADTLRDAAAYLNALPTFDVGRRVAKRDDARLMQMGRLDCDWQGECVRCLTQLPRDGVEPGLVVGATGLVQLAEAAIKRPAHEEWWLIFIAQHPQGLAGVIEKVGAFLKKTGVRMCYYAFDEASRTMPCFPDLAPHLDVLIHDEAPLAEAGRLLLRPDCLTVHRSWVANLLPFQASFNEAPEKKILFLGSQLGLTDHRKRQIDFLKKEFKDRFVASHDHSVSVADRLTLNRYQVGFCPEGRKFTTPAMSQTHTDRPFWSGCLGMVPVSEDSRQGGRLQSLAEHGLIRRYPHGDLKALAEACEQALDTPIEERRRIYNHFNRHETVGTVVAQAIAALEASRATLPEPVAR